jgi:hypothetical protein
MITKADEFYFVGCVPHTLRLHSQVRAVTTGPSTGCRDFRPGASGHILLIEELNLVTRSADLKCGTAPILWVLHFSQPVQQNF